LSAVRSGDATDRDGLHILPVAVLRNRQDNITVTDLRHIKRKGRPWIAMMAAYAIALQMMLSAAVASQMEATPSSGPFPICYGAGLSNDGSGQGDTALVHQASCVLCSMGLSAPVDVVPSAVGPVCCGTGIVIEAVAARAHLPQAPPSPRLSQGPPQSA
jgi:hypothetical protein